LTEDGLRARTSTLWCRYVDDPAVRPPRVAYAVGRSVGSAVVRNRIRRQLRAIVAGLASGSSPLLPHGCLLVGATPAAIERSFEELANEVKALVCSLTGVRASAGRR
jgi:ribonuclease P protein component